jgi:hypothetical protein
MNMNLLMAEVASEMASNAPHFPVAAVLVLVAGFIAAVSIGSIAWYNSKRPMGWEDKERPNMVPKVDKEEIPTI